jgi:hypothetical protein
MTAIKMDQTNWKYETAKDSGLSFIEVSHR